MSSTAPLLWRLFLASLLIMGAQAKWFEDKKKHQPYGLSSDELRKVADPSKKVNFEQLLDPLLIPRDPGTDNNKKVAEYIKKHMKDLGWTVETDEFEDETPLGKKPFQNIIATLKPEIRRRLVIACHFDSKYFAENNFVGATDSAVPCAMMIHAAHTLESYLTAHKNGGESDVTLQYIFFDGEEAFKEWTDTDSRYGSRHLAKKWEATPFPPGNADKTTELHRMDMLWLLDLIGASNPPPQFPDYFKATSRWHKELVATEKTLRKEAIWSGSTQGQPFFVPNNFGEIEDDHTPFLERGVDILHMIASPFPKAWHTPNDNKAALDFKSIENLNRIIRVYVVQYLHLMGTPSSRSSATSATGSVLWLCFFAIIARSALTRRR